MIAVPERAVGEGAVGHLGHLGAVAEHGVAAGVRDRRPGQRRRARRRRGRRRRGGDGGRRAVDRDHDGGGAGGRVAERVERPDAVRVRALAGARVAEGRAEHARHDGGDVGAVALDREPVGVGHRADGELRIGAGGRRGAQGRRARARPVDQHVRGGGRRHVAGAVDGDDGVEMVAVAGRSVGVGGAGHLGRGDAVPAHPVGDGIRHRRPRQRRGTGRGRDGDEPGDGRRRHRVDYHHLDRVGRGRPVAGGVAGGDREHVAAVGGQVGRAVLGIGQRRDHRAVPADPVGDGVGDRRPAHPRQLARGTGADQALRARRRRQVDLDRDGGRAAGAIGGRVQRLDGVGVRAGVGLVRERRGARHLGDHLAVAHDRVADGAGDGRPAHQRLASGRGGVDPDRRVRRRPVDDYDDRVGRRRSVAGGVHGDDGVGELALRRRAVVERRRRGGADDDAVAANDVGGGARHRIPPQRRRRRGRRRRRACRRRGRRGAVDDDRHRRRPGGDVARPRP